MHRQAGAATEQGMHAIAPQERTGMVRGSVTGGGIGIGSAPGQDGRTIDNEIASTDHMATHGTPDREDEERLKRRRSCCLPAFAQLGRAGDARAAIGSQWQATSQGQSWPTLEPVMHILVGESPKRFEQGDQEQRLFAIAAGATTCSFREWRWTTPMRHLNGQAAQRQEMQGLDQAQGVDMQGTCLPGLHLRFSTMI